MRLRLQNLWQRVRTSFWFIPAVMTFSAIVLSFLMVFVDRRIESGADGLFGFVYSGGPEGARLVLSTIAGSMITVAGVVFSITMVALTMASTQFGPRLLRNFMHDTGNQVVLGTFIATFVYCLLVLRTVRTVEEEPFVPSISVAIAVVLALASIIVLIYFIHHVSVSMQADQVILGVYGDLRARMQRLFHEELVEGKGEDHDGEAERKLAEEDYPRSADVPASASGYLQALDHGRMLDIACRNDLLILVPHRPGDYIVEGITLVGARAKEAIDESLVRQLEGAVIVGSQRTPEQDAEFAVHQLVEVAVRALSPGINDPYTAMSCIDRLGAALCFLCGREFPSPYHYDDEGKLRVIYKPVTFDGIVDAAFDQIRQYGRSSVAVTIRLLEALEMIAVLSRSREQRDAVLRHAEMVLSSSRESLHEENDLKDVRERYQIIVGLLEERERARD